MNEFNEKVQQFDRFFIKNYVELLKYTKRINPRHHYEDTLQDVYINLRTTIGKRGYEGDDYMNFTKRSITNFYYNLHRAAKKYEFVEIDDVNYSNNIENKLLDNEYGNQQEKENNDRNTFLTTMVYEYIDKYRTPREVFIFKTYYLLKHKHLNYKQLAEATGFSQKTVCLTIKTIKKDLRRSLKCYILNNQSMDELLKEVELVLGKNPSSHWKEYLDTYKKINNGAQWNGCSCKANKLKEAIQGWYNNNKPK